MIPRAVSPERLDELSPDDPLALGSRRDLVRVNAFRRATGIVTGLLIPHRPARVLEIGAGDGALMLGVARRLGLREVTLLDQHPLLSSDRRAAFAEAGTRVETVAADVFAFLADESGGAYDAIAANLFLHHFEDARLAELLRLASRRAPLFVACEPKRSRPSLAGVGMMRLIGCNEVTRHDARISVLAGFAGRELSALWPSGEGKWKLEEGPAPPFSHVFAARRTIG